MDIDVNAIADDVAEGLKSLDRIAKGVEDITKEVEDITNNGVVDPEVLEKIADALARLGCLEVTHVLPVDCEDVRAFMKGWEWLTNAHRDTAAAEERKARAMEDISKAEGRTAEAMESLANELGNISSGFTGLENAIREADFGVDTTEIERGLEKVAETINHWSPE